MRSNKRSILLTKVETVMFHLTFNENVMRAKIVASNKYVVTVANTDCNYAIFLQQVPFFSSYFEKLI